MGAMTDCAHPQPDSQFKRDMERYAMKDKLKVVPSDLVARYKSDLAIRESRLSDWPHVWPESQGSKVAYEYETERLRETIATLESLTADNADLKQASQAANELCSEAIALAADRYQTLCALQEDNARLQAENVILREGMKGDYDLDMWIDWRLEATPAAYQSKFDKHIHTPYPPREQDMGCWIPLYAQGSPTLPDNSQAEGKPQ